MFDPGKDYAQQIDKGAVKDFEDQSDDYQAKRDESIAGKKEYKVIISPSRASFFLDLGSNVKILQGECHRHAFLNKKGFPITNRPDPKSIRKMRFGREFERVEHIYEEKAGIMEKHNFRMNKEITPNVLLSCEVDSIVRLSDNKLYIIEDKSYDGYYAIRHVCGNKSRRGMPKYDHIAQSMYYLAIATDFLDKNEFSETTIFHYRIRSNMDPKFHILQLDKVLDVEGNVIDAYPLINGTKYEIVSLKELFSRSIILSDFIINNKLPPRDATHSYSEDQIRYMLSIDEVAKSAYKAWQEEGKTIGDWQCSPYYCRYFHICMGDRPKEIDTLPSDDEVMSKLGQHTIDTSTDIDSSMW